MKTTRYNTSLNQNITKKYVTDFASHFVCDITINLPDNTLYYIIIPIKNPLMFLRINRYKRIMLPSTVKR